MYDWVTLLYCGSWHNTVNQLYFNLKKRIKKFCFSCGISWRSETLPYGDPVYLHGYKHHLWADNPQFYTVSPDISGIAHGHLHLKVSWVFRTWGIQNKILDFSPTNVFFRLFHLSVQHCPRSRPTTKAWQQQERPSYLQTWTCHSPA